MFSCTVDSERTTFATAAKDVRPSPILLHRDRTESFASRYHEDSARCRSVGDLEKRHPCQENSVEGIVCRATPVSERSLRAVLSKARRGCDVRRWDRQRNRRRANAPPGCCVL